MGALALGIVLIVGYFYQSYHPKRRLELVRSSGYHIYFKAGLSGLVILLIAFLIWSLIDYFDFPSFIIDFFGLKESTIYLKNTEYWAEIKLIAIFTLMLLCTSLYIAIRNFQTDKSTSLDYVKKIAHELELLIIESVSNVRPIRVELDCGKVYVGIAETPNIDRGEVSFLTIIPLLSGYLDENKKIIFNNNYYRHYEEYIHDNKFDDGTSHTNVTDFSIVIPIEQIVIASRFSIDSFIKIRGDNSSALIGPPKPEH